ncbi:MAG: hypothetical protein O6761_07820 [Thaumarchaeota archaeon]|nr:hypothetical protein [Nitrososphaerota archaeon]
MKEKISEDEEKLLEKLRLSILDIRAEKFRMLKFCKESLDDDTNTTITKTLIDIIQSVAEMTYCNALHHIKIDRVLLDFADRINRR